MTQRESVPLTTDDEPLAVNENELGVDEQTGESAGLAGVIGAALGAVVGGPPGAALGAAGGMALGAAAELATHGLHHSASGALEEGTPVREHEHRWVGSACEICGAPRPDTVEAPKEQGVDGSE